MQILIRWKIPVSAGIFYFCIMLVTSKEIREALSGKLPGSISHKKALPKNRILEVAQEQTKKVKHSSVLLLLFIENDELTACLIKRPVHMKHHAGQIALPGGRIEQGEAALDTALRETWEEIGIHKKEIEILGSLSELYVEVSRFLIHPFVGWLKQKPETKINKNEVEKVILFPLKNFTTEFDEVELDTIKGRISVPCVRYENEIIWGATAMILAELKDILEK